MIYPHRQLRTVANSDGAAILDIASNQITCLNSTGGFVWVRLQEGLSVDQIIDDLAVESNTDPHIVEQDVDAFLRQLQSVNLLGD